MRFLGIIAGVILGFSLQETGIFPVIYGALLGFLVTEIWSLKRKIANLETKPQEYRKPSVADETAKPSKPETRETANPPSVKTEVAVEAVKPEKKSQPEPAAKVKPEPTRVASQVPRAPVTPSHDSSFFPQALGDFLAGKNTAVIAGVFILFIGLVFLFKYAIEHSLIPIEVRLIFAGLVACAMLFFGWRLRIKRTTYALILQGGGAGILYLTIFVSFRFYKLIPPGPAFLFLFLVMAFSMTLAVLQNSRTLAVLSTTGGFLAPILTSTGEGNYVALFGYYAVINAGILAVSLYRSWKVLNLVGFVFTFGVAAIWGGLNYTPENLAVCEGFLILFFLMYSVIGVLFSLKQPPDLKGIVDSTLVFALPISFIGMQFYLVHDHKYYMAYSSLGLGMYYLGLTSYLFRKQGKGIKTLLEAFLVLGIIFSSLAIPLAFDAPATSAFWAFEGAGLIWLGLRQGRLSVRIFGYLLQLGSWFFFVQKITFDAPDVFFNGQFTGLAILCISSFFIASLYLRNLNGKNAWNISDIEETLSRGFTILGILWWFCAGSYQLTYLVWDRHYADALVVFTGLSILGFFLVAGKWKWNDLEKTVYFLLPVLYLYFVYRHFDRQVHPFQGVGVFTWPLNFVIFYGILFFKNPSVRIPVVVMHLAGLLLLNILLTLELRWLTQNWLQVPTLWSGLSLVIPSLVILQLFSNGKILTKKFFLPYRDYYLTFGGRFVFYFAILFVFYINIATEGNPAPLPYVPFFNPVDILSLVVIMMTLRWSRIVISQPDFADTALLREYYPYVAGFLTFTWVNMMLARNIHYLGNIPWSIGEMYDSMMVQMIYSIFWAVTGFAFMVAGNRVASRPGWMLGAVFMALVVVKLFIVDLSRTATLFRIASFVVVGLILLVIGYLAPVPRVLPEDEKNNTT